MKHQVDLILGVAMNRVVELGVPVMENDEKVIVLHRSYFLLDVFHGHKSKKNSK